MLGTFSKVLQLCQPRQCPSCLGRRRRCWCPREGSPQTSRQLLPALAVQLPPPAASPPGPSPALVLWASLPVCQGTGERAGRNGPRGQSPSREGPQGSSKRALTFELLCGPHIAVTGQKRGAGRPQERPGGDRKAPQVGRGASDSGGWAGMKEATSGRHQPTRRQRDMGRARPARLPNFYLELPHPKTSPAVSAASRAGDGSPTRWCSAVPEPPAAGGTAS